MAVGEAKEDILAWPSPALRAQEQWVVLRTGCLPWLEPRGEGCCLQGREGILAGGLQRVLTPLSLGGRDDAARGLGVLGVQWGQVCKPVAMSWTISISGCGAWSPA